MQVELKAKTRQETSRSAAQTLRKPQKTRASDMAKWVYTFGDGAAEGATCSAARAQTLPKWRTSACRCRSLIRVDSPFAFDHSNSRNLALAINCG
jgi:hypothetical protein